MNKKTISRILARCAIGALISVCFSQSRSVPQRSVANRAPAPFLQQAKQYEETPNGSRLVLKNGMTILVDEFRAMPLVSIQAYAATDSMEEAQPNIVLAEMLASLVYRHPADKSTGTVGQNIYALGGTARYSVDCDGTKFEVVVPALQWKRALNLLSDALLNLSLNEGDLEQEAGLLESGARDALDEAPVYAREKTLETAFDPIHLISRSEIAGGATHSVTKDSLARFHAASYIPSKMLLVLSGDVTSSEVLNEVARIYSRPGGSAVKTGSVLPKKPQSGFRYRTVRGNITIPQVLFGFHAVAESAADYRALEVLRAALGLGEGSVFNCRLRDTGIIDEQETDLLGFRTFGYLLVRMEVPGANLDRSQIAALTEIELLKREELSGEAIARAIAQLELAYWKRLDTVSGRAETLARFEALGDWKRINRYIAELKKISPSDVKRVAGKYLNLNNCTLLEYLPDSGEPRNTTAEGVKQTLEGLLDPSADEEQAKLEKEVVPFVKTPPNTESFKFSEIQYPFQLASILRGPEMVIREDHRAPLIEMGIYYPGGKFSEGQENAGITTLMTDLMLRGTKEMQSRQFYQQVEAYGGSVHPVVTDDYFGFDISMLSGNFEAGLNLLLQSIKTPFFDADSVERQKMIQAGRIARRRLSKAYPVDLLKEKLFPGFSYSKNGLGTEASLSKITPDAVTQWHAEHVKNFKPFIVAIGDTKGTSLASSFVKELSGSRMRDAKIPEEWAKALDKGAEIEENWNRNQSVILVGFQAPPEDDEDAYAVKVLENLVGNWGRLAQQLRYKLGAAHDVFVTFDSQLRGGRLMAMAVMDPADEERVYRTLKDEIRRIAADPGPYRDFRSAVNASVGMHEILNQTRQSQIRAIIESMLSGKGWAGFQSVPVELQKVSEEDLSEIAQKILKLEKAVIVRLHGVGKQ